jgi:biopolymer transport protein ExbD
MSMPRLASKSLLKRKRSMEEAEMDITPMIDCTFLLLIFFLVTSKMKPELPVDLPKAKHGAVVVEQSSIILTMAQDGETVSVYRGNSTAPADLIEGTNPLEQEDLIAQYVEEESRRASPPKKYVIIKAARGLKHREVSRIQRAAGRAEVEQLYVAILESE